MRLIDPNKKLVQEYVYEQKQLPTHLPVAQYIRQSSETQIKHNKRSTNLQDGKFTERLVAMGYQDTPESIIKIVLDQGKTGQMTKQTDKGRIILAKEGIALVEWHMKNRTIGAVATFSPSRLFRDLTRVYYTEFVDLCETYRIPVITYSRIYWPDDSSDMNALIRDFAEAARFIDEEIHGKLLPAKYQAIEESISYGGGSVPLGYIIGETDDRKYYVVYDPHADCIRYIFKRYRELGGNLPKLGRELRDTGFMFPAFTGIEKPPHVSLHFDKDRGGYVIKTRTALQSILTNPAYIGWYCFNGSIISKEAHAPIVPFDDFLYAYNRLSPVTLSGEANSNKPITSRRTQTGCKALLEDVFSYDGVKAYVVDGSYRAREDSSGFGGREVINVALPVRMIDRYFAEAFLNILVGVQQAAHEGNDDEPTVLDALAATVNILQKAKGEEAASLQEKLKRTDKEIAGFELDKQSCRRTGNAHGLDEANKQLKLLYETRSALVERAKFAASAAKQLAQTQSLLAHAVHTWDDLPFENKHTLVTLCVQSANAVYLSPHIVKLTVTLLPPLSGLFTGYLFTKRGKKPEYSPAELDTIRRLYPHADRLELLQALPNRSWAALVHQAMEMGVERFTRRNTSSIDLELSYQDEQVRAELMEVYRLKYFDRGCAFFEFDSNIGQFYQRATGNSHWYPMTGAREIAELSLPLSEKQACPLSSANG